MSILVDWLHSGVLPAIAIAVLWIEIAVLCVLATRPLARLSALAANAFAGTFLIASLGVALTSGNPVAILMFLAGALVAHILDLRGRLNRQDAGLRR